MNLYLDLPKPDTINKYVVRIEPPLDPKRIELLSKNNRQWMAEKRKRFQQAGLTTLGKARRRSPNTKGV